MGESDSPVVGEVEATPDGEGIFVTCSSASNSDARVLRLNAETGATEWERTFTLRPRLLTAREGGPILTLGGGESDLRVLVLEPTTGDTRAERVFEWEGEGTVSVSIPRARHGTSPPDLTGSPLFLSQGRQLSLYDVETSPRRPCGRIPGAATRTPWGGSSWTGPLCP